MKIVFVIGSTNDSHARNRIDEFVENGLEVEVYGYDRQGRKRFETSNYTVKSLGEIKDASYLPRIKKYVADVIKLKKKYRNQNVVFFLNCLDIALIFRIFYHKAKFIYEEADLVHSYRKGEKLLEFLDKRVIKRSLFTILTSEGFVQYHYGYFKPDNVIVIPNKLNPEIQTLSLIQKRDFNQSNIHFGFVGKPRFDSIYNFINVVCSNFPNCDVDIFGGPIEHDFEDLKQYSNCHFHGFFKNPIDLPKIYSSIDLLITTYDYRIGNVKFAEPNKIYESIYFETPIIVSTETFLANKVNELGIGFVVDPFNKEQIVEFVKSLTYDELSKKIRAIRKIEKKDALNINNEFFKKLKDLEK